MSGALTLAVAQLEVELLAALRAVEEAEQGKTAVLLWDPHRLAAVLVHALGVEAPLVLTLYGEEEPRRYLVPPGNATPALAWTSRNLLPARKAWAWLKAAGKGLVLHEVSVWRPGDTSPPPSRRASPRRCRGRAIMRA